MSTKREDIIRQLAASLPDQRDVFGSGDIELQARAVLQFVIKPNSTTIPMQGLAVNMPDALTCPNCDVKREKPRSPYCGEHCREMAGFVRQFRSGIALGWIHEPEKQVALGQVLWHVLGGGRPLRVQIAPARARETALKRENGTCQSCGGPATTVDHIGSGCNRPINLRAVCETCCTDRAFGDPHVAEREGFHPMVSEISTRISSPVPLRCCDDAETWDWREFLKSRQKALILR